MIAVVTSNDRISLASGCLPFRGERSEFIIVGPDYYTFFGAY